MKMTLLVALLIGSNVFAQSMNVKDISTDDDTTIEIRKGKKTDAQYEIVSGSEDISGDPAPLLKEARENWKKACADWKKETKEMNSDNKVITLNCGKMDCSTVAMESSCKSTGTHKIRVQVK